MGKKKSKQQLGAVPKTSRASKASKDGKVANFLKTTLRDNWAFVLGACVVVILAILLKMVKDEDVERSSGKRFMLASRSDVFSIDAPKRMNVTCSKTSYTPKVEGCSPSNCARVVVDDFIGKEDALSLRRFAEKVMSYGGGAGGATIFDVSYGALSKGSVHIDFYHALKMAISKQGDEAKLSLHDYNTIVNTEAKLRQTIESTFSITPGAAFLTKPTFISRLRSDNAVTMHDEYWHEHVDTIAYGSFCFTALIYLSTSGEDFEGGELVFMDNTTKNTVSEFVVQPVIGRLATFTSGSENVHRVTRVTSGTRFAFTIAYTCDQSAAVSKFMSHRRDAFA